MINNKHHVKQLVIKCLLPITLVIDMDPCVTLALEKRTHLCFRTGRLISLNLYTVIMICYVSSPIYSIFVTTSVPVLLTHRTFLRELENCVEKPELVGTCFLKRVSNWAEGQDSNRKCFSLYGTKRGVLINNALILLLLVICKCQSRRPWREEREGHLPIPLIGYVVPLGIWYPWKRMYHIQYPGWSQCPSVIKPFHAHFSFWREGWIRNCKNVQGPKSFCHTHTEAMHCVIRMLNGTFNVIKKKTFTSCKFNPQWMFII